MKIRTGWLSPPDAINGLDHLGTQMPCQLIYQQLMPGITNVTDRARYYSLYPWLIWSFNKRHPDADAERFVHLFRRSDFLLTLIAERHAHQTGEPDFLHGAAMAGRAQLEVAFAHLKASKVINLDEFATREKVRTRYFQAKLGGLGQYYLGTLVDLRVLDSGGRDWVEYSTELGRPLAEAVDAATKPDLFWRVANSGRVSAGELDALSTFCPCGLKHGTTEHSLLKDLFLADREEYEEGLQRRASIAMFLHLALDLEKDDGLQFDVATFRSAIYSGHLSGDITWTLPDSLIETRTWWGIYQLNELLSLSFLSLLGSSLSELESSQTQGDTFFQTVEELADYIAKGPIGLGIVKSAGTKSYKQYMDGHRSAAPKLADWENAKHEMQLCEQLLSAHRNANGPNLVALAFEVLSLVNVRLGNISNPYEGLISAEELHHYPINLHSVKRRTATWEHMTIQDVLADIVKWTLVTHLSVSLRKLRQTGRSTFRFRQGELGLELTDEVPQPTRTTPRFNTTAQMLMDLGALRATTDERRGPMKVTPLGRSWMARHEG